MEFEICNSNKQGSVKKCPREFKEPNRSSRIKKKIFEVNNLVDCYTTGRYICKESVNIWDMSEEVT